MRHIPDTTIRVMAVLIMLVLLLAFTGCDNESDDIPEGPPVTVDGLISEGWSSYNSGDFEDAISIFSEAANADAKNLEAYLGMGYAFTQQNELVNAYNNLSNVINLSTVMVEELLITASDSVTLCAEAYAGMAATELATGDYENAVLYAQTCLEYDPSFNHRWVGTYNAMQIKVVMAEAYYADDLFSSAMFIVDEITGSFISGSTTLQTDLDTVEVVLEEETWLTGVATLHSTNTNLVYPVSVSTTTGEECEIMDFVPGDNEISFRCAPIPTQGQQFTIEYMYATNFGAFLIELRDAIEGL